MLASAQLCDRKLIGRIPLTATIFPFRSRLLASRISSSESGSSNEQSVIELPRATRASDGPHVAQAFGWAWKRRSVGLRYSASHAAHIVNFDIVVVERSYGMLWMMV
jgi:hypothetical protein